MPYITVAGERLFYALVEGDPARKRNLILVHGAGGDHTHWPAELRRLPGVNVFGLDLPGHGHSTGQGRSSVDDYADTVDLFAQAVQLERASVAGHSMGGAIAQTLALRRPPWLVSVILVGTGARLRVHPLILEGLHSAQTPSPTRTAPPTRTEPPTRTTPPRFEAAIDAICQWQYGPTTSEQIQRKGRQQLLSVDPAVIHDDYVACNAFDVMDRVKEITLPTLIVAGSADKMTPAKYSQYLHDQIPGSQLVEIKDGGHMMAVEKPIEVAQAVAHFLGML